MTEHTLTEYIRHNDILNSIFKYTDPDLIAHILMTELNIIIDCIAPQNVRQVKKNYLPYMTKDLRQRQQTVKNLHTTAKISNDNNDWLNFRNSNAQFKKDIDNRQKQYIFINWTIGGICGQRLRILTTLIRQPPLEI